MTLQLFNIVLWWTKLSHKVHPSSVGLLSLPVFVQQKISFSLLQQISCLLPMQQCKLSFQLFWAKVPPIIGVVEFKWFVQKRKNNHTKIFSRPVVTTGTSWTTCCRPMQRSALYLYLFGLLLVFYSILLEKITALLELMLICSSRADRQSGVLLNDTSIRQQCILHNTR